VPIGHGFSVFGHRKVMENTFWKGVVTLDKGVIYVASRPLVNRRCTRSRAFPFS